MTDTQKMFNDALEKMKIEFMINEKDYGEWKEYFHVFCIARASNKIEMESLKSLAYILVKNNPMCNTITEQSEHLKNKITLMQFLDMDKQVKASR